MALETVNIAVTGGAGSIGWALVKSLLTDGKTNIFVISRNEGLQHERWRSLNEDQKKRIKFISSDIRNVRRIRSYLKDSHTVFHCAAMKHVSICEQNPQEASSINIEGTSCVVDALSNDNKLILLSTDKAANPINTMGATKLAAEKIVLGRKNSAVVRFGNVKWSRGSALEIWLEALQKGEKPKFTDPTATRYSINNATAVNTLIRASSMVNKTNSFMYIPSMRSDTVENLFIYALVKYQMDQGLDWVPNPEKEIIGLQKGEKLHEACITDEEVKFVSNVYTHGIILFKNDTPLRNDHLQKSVKPYLSSAFALHVNAI